MEETAAATTTNETTKITVEDEILKNNNGCYSCSSPRGPGIEVEYYDNDSNNTSLVQSIARQGSRAIQELERVLFFTDLKDDEKRQQAARDGLNAIEDLEQLLEVSGSHTNPQPQLDDNMMKEIERPQQQHDSGDPTACGGGGGGDAIVVSSTIVSRSISPSPSFSSSVYGKESSGCTHITCYALNVNNDEDEESTCSMPKNSTNPAATSKEVALAKGEGFTMNRLVEVLKAHFLAALQSGHKAWKDMEKATQGAAREAERTLLFTDLDETKMAAERASMEDRDRAVWKEVEVVLQDMERQLAVVMDTAQPALEKGQSYLKAMEQRSINAYKECERKLLFTDLDDNNKNHSLVLEDDGTIEVLPHDNVEMIAEE